MHYIIFVLVAILGYVVGRNSAHEPTQKTDEQLMKELLIAKNLNESLLKDKHELQEKLWKINQTKINFERECG